MLLFPKASLTHPNDVIFDFSHRTIICGRHFLFIYFIFLNENNSNEAYFYDVYVFFLFLFGYGKITIIILREIFSVGSVNQK